jgi:hypothetical protein
MSEIKYSVTPSLIGEDQITLSTKMTDPVSGVVKEISKEVMNLKDKAVRQALIARGWTPPGGFDSHRPESPTPTKQCPAKHQ